MAKVLHHLEKRARKIGDAGPRKGGTRLLTGSRLRFATTVLALFVALGVASQAIIRKDEQQAAGGTRVTDCDRLAAHPSDTQKIAPGVVQADVEIARARQACHEALAQDPGNGRILYQLGRTYFYAGDYATGIAYFRQSDAAGYAQGQFVLGLILVQGNGTDPNACGGGALWLKAARQRHLYSKIYLVNNWLDGMFTGCALGITEPELDSMVSAAEELADTPAQRDDVAIMRQNWINRPRQLG
jgi:tetratricopeptide (TPR) repeat protein